VKLRQFKLEKREPSWFVIEFDRDGLIVSESNPFSNFAAAYESVIRELEQDTEAA